MLLAYHPNNRNTWKAYCQAPNTLLTHTPVAGHQPFMHRMPTEPQQH